MRALWSDRQNRSHNVSQKVKRVRRFSERRVRFGVRPLGAAGSGRFSNGRRGPLTEDPSTKESL